MSKAKFLLFFLCLSSIVLGQSYTPFPTDSARWNCLYWYQNAPWPGPVTNYEYQLLGDTILNGMTYKKIYLVYTDESSFATEYYGGLREDSSRNIFFFPEFVEYNYGIEFPNYTNEHLLYTFDSLYIGKIFTIGSYTLVVGDIDSVLIGNSYRNRYLIWGGAIGSEYWIEGIGSDNELFSNYTFIFEWWYYTLCFTDTATYHINSPDGYDSCHYTLSVDIPTQKYIRLFPNPVKESFNLEVPVSHGEVIIYNIQGAALKREKIAGTEMKLDVSELASGLYLIEIIGMENRVYLKFLKE